MDFTDDEKTHFAAFDAYNFDNDKAFQTGLSTIPSNTDPQVLENAKLFYYSRAVQHIDRDRFAQWKESNRDKLYTPPSIPFAEVVGMITRGEPVPGILQIPDKLNDQAPSTSTMKVPPKPWETTATAPETEANSNSQ